MIRRLSWFVVIPTLGLLRIATGFVNAQVTVPFIPSDQGEPFTLSDWVGYVFDANQDGLDDLIGKQVGSSGLRLYVSTDDGFEEVTNEANLPAGGWELKHVVDINRDFYPDLILNQSALFQVLIYSPETQSYQSTAVLNLDVALPGEGTISSMGFQDIDGDACLEWCVMRLGNPGELYAANEIGLNTTSASLKFDLMIRVLDDVVRADFADLDSDLDFDVAFAIGSSSQYDSQELLFYENFGGRVFQPALSDGATNTRVHGFLTAANINGDHQIDFVCGAADCCSGLRNIGYLSSEPWVFNQVNNLLVQTHDPYYYSMQPVDVNGDRRMDFVWTNLTANGTSNDGRIQVHLQNEAGAYVESSVALGVHQGGQSLDKRNRSQIIDFNDDAKPDLAINVSRASATGPSQSGNWQMLNQHIYTAVKIRLRSCLGRSEGLGAQIDYLTNGEWYFHPVQSSSSVIASPTWEYLSAPAGYAIDSLVVNWVSGQSSTLSNLTDGDAVIVSELPECTGAICNEGVDFVGGCTYPAAVNFSATAQVDDGTCNFEAPECGEGTYFDLDLGLCLPLSSQSCQGDFNQDGIVQVYDLILFLQLFGQFCD